MPARAQNAAAMEHNPINVLNIDAINGINIALRRDAKFGVDQYILQPE